MNENLKSLNVNKKSTMSDEVKKSFKYILGYCTCIVFFVGISVYLHMLIFDQLEQEKHSKEEKIWMYGFLAILIIGFILSYNIIYSNI